MKPLLAELKRRNVYKVAAAYAVVGWLVIQIATGVLPAFHAPDWVAQTVVVLVLLGFPIALVLAWAFELTPEGIKRAEDVPPAESITRRTGRKLIRFTIVLAVIAAALLAYQSLWPRLTAKREPTRTPAATAVEHSIAVLPLLNTSGDSNNEYFSDGLSEELIAVLAKIPDLKVIGRSSSFVFKGRQSDSRTIGEKLGVKNLLEGSVRKQGDRVRIVAELVNAADGRAVWTETYDRELKDVFAVQSEIATAVAEQLKIKLFGAPRKSDAAPSNDNLAAYHALQQGVFFQRVASEAGTRKAIEYYSEAIRLDPKYALAYAKLSTAWRLVGASWAMAGEISDAYAKARSAADTARSLAPDLSEAHEALGWLFVTPNLDFAAAEAEFQTAGKLAPADPSPKSALSYAFCAQGRLPEAERTIREALLLDPLDVRQLLILARILVADGRLDEAEAVLRNCLQLQPGTGRCHAYLANIALLRGDAAAAWREAQLEPAGIWREYASALTQQIGTDRAAADGALERFISGYSQDAAFQVAVLYAIRSDPDKMFEWLERAYVQRDSGLSQLFISPFIANYHGDPRFAALCQKLKLASIKPAR